MSAAATYIAYRHIDWKRKPDSKQRMLISHAVFWPVCAVGLKVMHLSFGLKKNWQMLAGALAGAGVIAGGFEGGYQLARKLVPKQSSFPPQTVTPPSPMTLQQAYNQGVQAGFRSALSSTYRPTTGGNARPTWAIYPPQPVYTRIY